MHTFRLQESYMEVAKKNYLKEQKKKTKMKLINCKNKINFDLKKIDTHIT